MIIRSDNCDGVVMKVFTNPTGDDFFIAVYNEKDGYNGFTTPTVKIVVHVAVVDRIYLKILNRYS